MKRFIFWLIVVGVIGGAGAAAYSHFYAGKHNGIESRYRTSFVRRGEVTRVVNSTGTVQPVRSVQVGSFVSGPIDEVRVDFNSKVEKGQILATIDSRIYKANLAREEATLAHSKADLVRVEALLAQAIRLEKRGLQLKPRHAIADTDLEQYTTDREALEAQVELAKAVIAQCEASLSNAKTNLKFCEIESPADGIIVDRKVDPGQTVAASFQTPVMFVVAPDLDKSVYVWASVDEADIGMIREAQSRDEPVTFTVDAYENDTFHGNIKQVRLNPTTVQNVVTYTVIVEAPNSELKLLPGMTATLAFQIEQHAQVLRIPNSALRFRPKPEQVRKEDRAILEGETGGGETKQNPDGADGDAAENDGAPAKKRRDHKVVWIIDGDCLAAVEIVVGPTDKSYTELVSGKLSEGQELVVGLRTASAK